LTLTYRPAPRFSLGLEWNPKADSTSPLANLLAVTEKKRRPALIFGTSSDRIGTPDGQAYYVTLSKDLSSVNGWPISPYVGAAYGTYDDKLRAMGGMYIRLPANFASTLIYDGVNFHPTLEYRFRERHVFTLLFVATEDPGVSYSIAF
jgi:hypothetical protein